MQITKENLTIIIVTIKSEKIIENCLNSIDPNIKKIIVENSSDEKFKNSIEKKFQNVKCYLTGKNLGMGSGNNFGLKKSTTDYVMILNPDTILKQNTLSEIFKISYNLDFAILSPISSDEKFPNFIKNKNNQQKIIHKDLFEVDRVDGYSMILNKSKFSNQFFDENIFMYLENDDLCLRMKKKNEKIYVYKKSIISHMGAKAVDEKYFEEVELSRNWHWNWSKFYFRKKHYGFFNAFFFNFPTFIKSTFKSIYYYLFNNRKKFKLYSCRASGFLNSFLNKESWYRPKFD